MLLPVWQRREGRSNIGTVLMGYIAHIPSLFAVWGIVATLFRLQGRTLVNGHTLLLSALFN